MVPVLQRRFGECEVAEFGSRQVPAPAGDWCAGHENPITQ